MNKFRKFRIKVKTAENNPIQVSTRPIIWGGTATITVREKFLHYFPDMPASIPD
jgi:hypothetical protein